MINESLKDIYYALSWTGYPILDALKEKYSDSGGKFLEVPQLGETLGLKVISRWLAIKNRKMTKQQEQVIRL